jgi:hypothetical protein
VLRKEQLERPRASACRDHRILPGLSIVTCLVLVLMVSLPVETWVRFLVWLIVGSGSTSRSGGSTARWRRKGRERGGRGRLATVHFRSLL